MFSRCLFERKIEIIFSKWMLYYLTQFNWANHTLTNPLNEHNSLWREKKKTNKQINNNTKTIYE